jgi:hypothetical protein
VVEHEFIDNQVVVSLRAIPPLITVVTFPPQTTTRRTFDFARWYGAGIDPITYACHRQIERFLAKQDAEVTVDTVVFYCAGLQHFLGYLVMLTAVLGRTISLVDINRDTVDGFISALDSEDISQTTKKNRYAGAKSVLNELCKRGLIPQTHGGEDATFPSNPFPGSHLLKKGERPLPKAQRQALLVALRQAGVPIFSDEEEPTAFVLSCALLLIAMYTGRNTTPLLEMTPDCLRPHPKENTSFLVFFKRRGYSTSKVPLREARPMAEKIEDLAPLRTTMDQLVRRVIDLSRRLRSEAPSHFANRIWLYRNRSAGGGHSEFGTVQALSPATLGNSIKTLIQQYDLRDTEGKLLRINVSRLRKTFVNRLHKILDGDITATAAAAGNSVDMVGSTYARPSDDEKKNWKFMGIALTTELLTNTLGATEKTPVARCSDGLNGEFSPKKGDRVCMNFLDCLRCRNLVVTGDDLYRLFSFYWRILSERKRMPPRRWQKQLAHIVRLIDRDVIESGLANGTFKKDMVDKARERARKNPHPFWRCETIIEDVREL